MARILFLSLVLCIGPVMAVMAKPPMATGTIDEVVGYVNTTVDHSFSVGDTLTGTSRATVSMPAGAPETFIWMNTHISVPQGGTLEGPVIDGEFVDGGETAQLAAIALQEVAIAGNPVCTYHVYVKYMDQWANDEDIDYGSWTFSIE